jgi:23S rRNA pseudouridine1911/1915/1917 synthase
MDLRILYEDEHLLAVNKPPGISVHPGAGPKTTTLVQGLLSHTSSLSTAGGSDRLGIVHRLDRDTSGVLLVAKNNRVHAALAAQFAERTVKKEYWALTWGPWKRSQLTVVAPLGRPRRNRKKIAVIKGGREAVTRFVVEKDHGFCAEIAAFPFTGRTHQIRVHLAHIHCPVVGDNNYGGSAPRGAFVPALYREKARQLLKLCSRQMLHARRIEFNHPATGQDMALEADFPDDIKEVRRYLAQKME